MNVSLALVLLFANSPQEAPPMPPSRDAKSTPTPMQQGAPTDPLFDREYIATDGPTFVSNAIEATRQGEVEARSARENLTSPELKEAAAKIGRQNEVTRTRLEQLAKLKGWRVPATNPDRLTTVAKGSDARMSADFVVQQISFHETTVAQFRAQLKGKSDAELQRTLRETLPGYEKNLELLLKLKH